MRKESNKEINILSKKGLFTTGMAAAILGTTAAGPFMTAHAAEPTDDNDNKSSESSKASMPVKVDDSKINKAVDDAKKAGLNVKKDADKKHDVKVSDVDKTQKEIQADYDKQIKELNKAKDDYAPKKAEYDKKKKEYDEARENPKFQGDKTEFSEDQLRKFLGDTPANVTYISGNTGKKEMKYSAGNLKAISDAEFKKFKEGVSDKDEYPKQEADNYIYVNLEKGLNLTYKNAVNDGKTGHDVDIKVTIEDVKMQKGHENDPKIAKINKKSIGVNEYVPIKEVKFKYDYIDSETGKPIKIDALMGKGDIDGDQYFKLDTDMDSVLKGSKVVQKGDQFWAAESREVYESNDPSTQVWTISRGVDSQTFTYGNELDEEAQAKMEKGVHFSDYFVDGAIEFGLDIPPIPKEPTKPEVKYHLNKLNAIAENHKDVEKGAQKEDTEATINGEKVAVGDQLTYPLTNSDLPQDRQDDIKSYVMEDTLPEGVTPDKEATEKNIDKSKWDVKIDGQKVTISANKDLLADMNKDKTKAYKVPTVGIVADVTKGGDANLDNTFDTIINDNTVKSSKVTNTPPPLVKKQAKKTVSTDKIIDIGKEYNYGLDFTVPNDKNYKKVQFKDHDMTNGSLDFEDVKVYADIDQDSSKDNKSEDSDKAEDSKVDDSKSNNDSNSNDKAEDNKANDTADDSKSEDSNNDNTTNNDNKDATDDSKSDKDVPTEGGENTGEDNEKPADNEKPVEGQQADETKDDSKSKDSKSENKTNDKGQDVTDQGKLEFDKEKDEFTWTANDPSKFLGKKVHIDVKAKVKDGKTLDKYKTKDKDENGNEIYSLPNVGHMVLDDDDTPTNEAPIKIVKAEPSIKKYIVENNKLLENNKGKEGEKLTYQLDAQFGSGNPKSISDELDKEKLDLNNVKIYEDNSKSNDSKADDSKSDNDKSSIDESNSKSEDSNDSKANDSKADDSKNKNNTESNNETSDSKNSKDSTSQQADETKENSKEAESNDTKSEDSSDKSAFDTKSAKDITDQGKLELNKDNESFTWTPNDPSKFNNKKVKVVIDSTIKKDLKYENGKAQIDNIATLKDGKDNKKSNKVTATLEKKPGKGKVETPKENPKNPSNPAQPQKEQPQKGNAKAKEQPQSPLPSTGSKTADGLIYGSLAVLAAAGAYIGGRKLFNRNKD